jgi:hypothetical protein
MANLIKIKPVVCTMLGAGVGGGCVNTKIWYRKESDLWAQFGGKIRPGEGRFI